MMRSKLFVLAFLFVGCFSAGPGSTTEDTSDGTTSGGTGGSTSGETTTTSDTDTAGSTGSVGTTSGTTVATGGSTGGESTGEVQPCPVGMAFSQGYCWAVAMCDEVSCSAGGNMMCKSNVETCAFYGLDPTQQEVFFPEWSEMVLQDIVDQLGFDGVDPGLGGIPSGYWNSTDNTLRGWGYGAGVNYFNPSICTAGDGIYYWPLHTCVPPR